MDAHLSQTPKIPAELPRQRDLTRISVGFLAVASIILSIGCSSNSTPKALPPQTMAPKPPDVVEPVSTGMQETEPE